MVEGGGEQSLEVHREASRALLNLLAAAGSSELFTAAAAGEGTPAAEEDEGEGAVGCMRYNDMVGGVGLDLGWEAALAARISALGAEGSAVAGGSGVVVAEGSLRYELAGRWEGLAHHSGGAVAGRRCFELRRGGGSGRLIGSGTDEEG